MAQLQPEKSARVQGGPIAEGKEATSSTLELGEAPQLGLTSQSPSTTLQGNSLASSIYSYAGAHSRANSPIDAVEQQPANYQPLGYVGLDHVSSTQSLVETWNKARITQEQRHELEVWVDVYIDYFKRVDLVQGMDQDVVASYLREYKMLAKLKPNSEPMRKHLGDYFDSVYDKIVVLEAATGRREHAFMEALTDILQEIEPSILNVKLLIGLLDKLLAKIDSNKTAFTASTYKDHAPTLESIHKLLLVIRLLDNEHRVARTTSSQSGATLHNRIKTTLQDMPEETEYYPIHYHAHLLLETLAQYEQPPSRFDRILAGVEGGLSVLKFVASCLDLRGACEGIRELGSLSLELISKLNDTVDQVESTCGQLNKTLGHFKTAFDLHPSERSYYSYHQALSLLSNLALKEQDPTQAQTCYADFLDYVDKLEQKNNTPGEQVVLSLTDMKALRYFAVRQLILLSLHGNDAIRQASITKLFDLGRIQLKGITVDQDILHMIFDGLAVICSQAGTAATLSKEKLRELLEPPSKETSPKKPAFRFLCCLYLNNPTAESADKSCSVILSWLDNKSLDEKLRDFSMLETYTGPVLNELFSKVATKLSGEPGTKAYQAKEKAAIEAQQEEIQFVLKSFYKHSDFKNIQSFLGGAPMSVEDMEYHLRLAEKRKKLGYEPNTESDHPTVRENRLQGVKTRISLGNLFEPRSVNPDEPIKKIDKVLLIGEPGTGKTVLTRKLAHDWANGNWGQKFQAVYVLPVRTLRAEVYDNNGHHCREATLATAIANECFSKMREEQDFKRLRDGIKASLNWSTTLVVLDGLDERHGVSEVILREAKGGDHRLLLTSRPYDIALERELADIEVDHMGLDIRQRDRFVYRTLAESKTSTAKEFLNFIKRHRLEEISLIPVNLKILCTLWEDKGTSMAGWRSPMGLPALYRALANFVWERFARESLERVGQKHGKEQKVKLFEDLEQIALTSFQKGEIIINPDTIEEVTGEFDYPLAKDAAFLLFQEIDRKYQFPHLTFHEYFMGRRLARQFLLRDTDEEMALVLKTHMYEPRYRRAFSFMAGEISKHMLKEVKSGVHKSSLDSIRALLQLVNTVTEEQTSLQYLIFQLRLLNEWTLATDIESAAVDRALTKMETEFKLGDSISSCLDNDLHRLDEESLNSLVSLFAEASAVTGHYSKQISPLIQKALQGSDAGARRSAARVLPALIREGKDIQLVLPYCKQALKDPDAGVREAACKTLPILVDQGADLEDVSFLVENTLKDDGAFVRQTAIETLLALVERGLDIGRAFTLTKDMLHDVNSEVRQAACTALTELLERADVGEQVNQLVASLDTLDRNGRTPMHSAAKNGHLEVVKYLKGQGAKVGTPDKHGRTPMHSAAKNGHLEVVKYLKGQGAKVDTPDKHGRTPMHSAAKNGHLEVVKYLKGQGA
ncbi:MAG: ankyrin repeat domain-containing protein, partial [Bacteroidota bacterium]